MKITRIERNGVACALVAADSGETLISDADSALEVLMGAKTATGTKNVIISKRAVTDAFFVLSTGLAGEILQKFVNYGGRIALYGDFSAYTSKPLTDFMRESNKGRDVFFVATQEEAVARLCASAWERRGSHTSGRG